MGKAAPSRDEVYTYRDYLGWDDGERWELIDGVPCNMTPAPSRRHQELTGELFRQLSNYLVDRPCKAYIAPFDVRLAEAGASDAEVTTVVQPDIAVVCDAGKLDERGCAGAPDLIVEILSPATARKDLKEKFAAYERAGVREYWTVDPAARTVMVFRLGADRRFGRPDVFAEEERVKVGIFDDLEIELATVFRE